MSERIFNTIRDYYRGSFGSGIWISYQEGHDCWTVEAGSERASTEHLTVLHTLCVIACQLFAHNCYEKARKALLLATAGMEWIFQAEHPMTLSFLFDLVLSVRWANRQEIALALLRRFSAFAEVLLGVEHPLRQVCRWLASVDPACFDEVVVRCFRSAGENLETNLGPMHRTTLRSRLSYTENMYRHEDINQEELLQWNNLLNKCERFLGTHDTRTSDIRSSLALLCLKRKDFVKAKKMAQDTIAHSRQARLPSDQYRLRTEGLYSLALSQYKLRETDSAEGNLRKAIALRISRCGRHNIRANWWLMILEDMLLRRGHTSSVPRMKAWREAILGSVYTDGICSPLNHL